MMRSLAARFGREVASARGVSKAERDDMVAASRTARRRRVNVRARSRRLVRGDADAPTTHHSTVEHAARTGPDRAVGSADAQRPLASSLRRHHGGEDLQYPEKRGLAAKIVGTASSGSRDVTSSFATSSPSTGGVVNDPRHHHHPAFPRAGHKARRAGARSPTVVARRRPPPYERRHRAGRLTAVRGTPSRAGRWRRTPWRGAPAPGQGSRSLGKVSTGRAAIRPGHRPQALSERWPPGPLPPLPAAGRGTAARDEGFPAAGPPLFPTRRASFMRCRDGLVGPCRPRSQFSLTRLRRRPDRDPMARQGRATLLAALRRSPGAAPPRPPRGREAVRVWAPRSGRDVAAPTLRDRREVLVSPYRSPPAHSGMSRPPGSSRPRPKPPRGQAALIGSGIRPVRPLRLPQPRDHEARAQAR